MSLTHRSTHAGSDLILVMAAVLAPMTELRIGRVGPAEMLAALWCINALLHRPHSWISRAQLFFWIGLLGSMSIGSLIGVANGYSGTQPEGIRIWVYLGLISIGVYSGLQRRKYADLKTLLTKISVTGTLLYFFLYMYSIYISESFLGMSLWYGDFARFSGGGKNPHQLAVLLAALVFAHMWGFSGMGFIRRIVALLLVALTIALGMATASATWQMAVAVGFLSGGFSLLMLRVRSSQMRVAMGLCISASVLLFWRPLANFLETFIETDPNGPGRLFLWTNISKTFALSPFFGLGPGLHSVTQSSSIKEYHNTYLEVLAMAGIIGVVIFLAYHARLLILIGRHPALLGMLASLAAYGLGGFAARRLIYWIFISIMYAIGESSRRNRLSTMENEPQGMNESKLYLSRGELSKSAISLRN